MTTGLHPLGTPGSCSLSRPLIIETPSQLVTRARHQQAVTSVMTRDLGTPGERLTTHNLVSGFIGPWLWASLPLSVLRVLRSVLTVYWFHCLPLIYGSINSVYTTPGSPYFWSMPHTTLDNCDLSRRMLWDSKYFNDDSDIAAPASPCSWSNIYPEAPRIRRMSLLDIRDRDNGGWWSSLGQWEGSTAREWPIRGREGR